MLTQRPRPRSHDWPTAQSLALAHPHFSPPRQARPPRLFVQSTQAGRLPLPHAAWAVPARQVPPWALEQQPPLHGWAILHFAVQLRAIVSQAKPLAQSAELLHPQLWLARHTLPAMADPQSAHVPPFAHAPGAVPLTQEPLAQQPN